MQIHKFNTKADLTKNVFELIKTQSETQSEISMALSGGSTPFPLYQQIATLPNPNFNVYQVDERYTLEPKFQNQSKLIEIFTKPNFILNLFDLHLSLKSCHKQYQQIISDVDDFDFTVLGFGTDGHFASIFDEETLSLQNDILITEASEIYPIKDRLTISLSRIIHSKKIIVLLCGHDKKLVLEKFLDPNIDASTFPAKALYSLPNIEIFCDF